MRLEVINYQNIVEMNKKNKLTNSQSLSNALLRIIMRCRCSFKGHEPEKYLTETDGYIATSRCKHCHDMLLDGFMWKIKHIPPPNSTQKQVEKWESYCENKWHELRRNI